MTPALRGDVASELYGNWLHRVTWLRDASNPFLESLALALKPALYPTGELVNGEYFTIVTRGVAIKAMQVIISGGFWGSDLILNNRALRSLAPARTLTFLECYRYVFN